jgi:hypothetical protein
MIKIILYSSLFILLFLGQQVVAQDNFLVQDYKIQNLINVHKAVNAQDSSIVGYRVQIFFESGNYSKELAMKTAGDFQQKYPEIPYYLSFKEPYFRIRVGDFRTIIEAKGFLQKIIADYPSAFEVKDKIYFPLLLD